MFKILKSQVILEVVTAPVTLGLFTVGGSLILCTPFSPWCLFGGVMFTLAGVGTALSNFFLHKEEIAAKALKKVFENQIKSRQEQAKALLLKLQKTTEKQDDRCLTSLQEIYFDFLKDINDNKLLSVPEALLEQLEQLFDACIKSLEFSYVLHEQATKLSPTLEKKAIARRKQILEDVSKNVESMFDSISQIRMLGLKDNGKDLEKIRSRVERSLNLAQEIDQLCNEETEPQDNKYQEYLKE